MVDHRKSGSIGGFYGNGIGGFHAVPFVLDASIDEHGQPNGLIEEDPSTSLEPMTPDKARLLSRAGDVQAFLESWRWADWNHLRITCVGRLPVITTWVNGHLVAELDTATIAHPHFDPEAVAELLGPTGHIAFEVHDNDPMMGEARWAPEARCRWRNIWIRDLVRLQCDQRRATQQADPIERVDTSRDRHCSQRMGAFSEKVPPQFRRSRQCRRFGSSRSGQAWSLSESKSGGSVSRSSVSETNLLVPHPRQRGLKPVMVGPSRSLVTAPQRWQSISMI